MRETVPIISGQNRGFLSTVVRSNRRKPVPDMALRSDKYFLCKLNRLYLAIFSIKKRSKSKLIEGYCFETFENSF